MNDLSDLNPDKLGEVGEALGQMGFDFVDAITDPLVSAHADGLHRIASDPGDIEAVNDAVGTHENLGFLLPGWFQVDSTDIKLNNREDPAHGDND